MLEKIINYQQKLTPKRKWLIAFYFTVILLFSTVIFGVIGFVLSVLFCFLNYKLNLTPATDKLAHFFWGSIYCLPGILIDNLLNINFFVLLFPSIPAAYKEIKDYYGGGTPEVMDFIFTIATGLTFLIINIK